MSLSPLHQGYPGRPHFLKTPTIARARRDRANQGDDMPQAELDDEHETPPNYPVSWELDALLIDGGPVHVRPLRPSDAEQLNAFHKELSSSTIYYRYFGEHPVLSENELVHLTTLDYKDRMAFGAFEGDEFIGVGRYDSEGPSLPAEVAFIVADAYQHRGVGTLLLENLVGYARELGINQFSADVLPDNPAMLRVFHESGLAVKETTQKDVIEVLLDLAPTALYLDRRDERERASEAASMAFFLRPSSVAVVGAGRTPGGVGHAIVRGLLAGDFTGTVYPVNPRARSVCGVLAYPTLSAIPERIDLAIVAVKAELVMGVAEDAAAAGVRALVIVSSGFAELGEQGQVLQAKLLRLVRRHGIRVVGPNCLGLCNTAPDVSCNATFAPNPPVAGPIALASQSGAVGIVLLEQARDAGLGISSFVSVGNKIDVSSNDLLCYWERDDATRVIALYLESFGNPRKFARIARRVGKTKPIVVLTGGRSAAGARGARSHTAAAATPAVTISALLSSSGVIEVLHLEEMLDVVGALAHCPLPTGRRVALIGNSGGPLILAADACAAAGLVVPELNRATQTALEAIVPPASACANPVDITADGGPGVLECVLDVTLANDEVDAVIAVVTSLISLSSADARRVLEAVANRTSKPVIACFLGGPPEQLQNKMHETRLASVAAPERAAGVVSMMASYAAWRAAPEQASPSFEDLQVERARSLVEGALSVAPEGAWLDGGTASEVLSAFGIPVVASLTVNSQKEAIACAERIGYPVVLKAGAGELVHKSDVGGVILDIKSTDELIAAFEKMSEALGDNMLPALIQTMATSGVETIVGLSSDPRFGPILLFGLGGVTTDLLKDRTFAVPPLSVDGAEQLISSIRSAPLLYGYRGSTPVDTVALRDVVLRVARLATELPEIHELDLNPVIASPKGALVVDCKIRVAKVPTGPDALMRALKK